MKQIKLLLIILISIESSFSTNASTVGKGTGDELTDTSEVLKYDINTLDSCVSSKIYFDKKNKLKCEIKSDDGIVLLDLIANLRKTSNDLDQKITAYIRESDESINSTIKKYESQLNPLLILTDSTEAIFELDSLPPRESVPVALHGHYDIIVKIRKYLDICEKSKAEIDKKIEGYKMIGKTVDPKDIETPISKFDKVYWEYNEKIDKKTLSVEQQAYLDNLIINKYEHYYYNYYNK